MNISSELDRIAKELRARSLGTVSGRLSIRGSDCVLDLQAPVGQVSLEGLTDRVREFHKTNNYVYQSLRGKLSLGRVDPSDWVSTHRDFVVLNGRLKFTVNDDNMDEDTIKLLVQEAVMDFVELKLK